MAGIFSKVICSTFLKRSYLAPKVIKANVKFFSNITAKQLVKTQCFMSMKYSPMMLSLSNSFAVHTAGDKELAKFLGEEIKVEKGASKSTDKELAVKGFEIKTSGSEVIFTKKHGKEVIRIKLNINQSVEDENALGLGEEQPESAKEEPQLVSRPPFTVEINKSGSTTLSIHCAFSNPADLPPPEAQAGTEEQFFDVIEIQEVALHDGELDETIYSISGSVMDGNLYDMLLNMLEERGIDADILDQMVDFCTAYEHKQYIDFLERLRNFVSSE